MSDMSNDEALSLSTVLPGETIPRTLVLLMSLTVGLLVGNLHYMTPLLAVIAADLGVTQARVGGVATLAVLAQTIAMLVVLPLGDVYDRRKLIMASILTSVAALLGVAVSRNVTELAFAAVAVGLATTGTHMTVSLAASMAPAAQRGRVVGTVISGLLVGILAARIVGGVVGGAVGWRSVYLLAAGVLTVLGLVVARVLPTGVAAAPQARVPYLQLLGSMWTLLRREPVLREACMFGGLTFGAFTAFWMTIAFHLATPPFHHGSGVAGLMGLFALAGALAAGAAGRLADRYGARGVTGAFLAVTLLSFGLLWWLRASVWGIGLGVLFMDLGVQGVHVCNQTRVYSLHPGARNRLGAIYIVTYFAGGSLGSALSIWAWSRTGWGGVCLVGAGMVLAAVARFLLGERVAGPQAPPAADVAIGAAA
jgi:predicted MFS family arabinose efflux permease